MLFEVINKIWKKIIISMFVIYIMFSLTLITNAENYEWTVINNIDTIETNSNIDIENTEGDKTDTLKLDCESAILIEQNSGKVLYEKNSHEQLRPASVTKLMSLLLIFEALENRTNYIRRQSSMQ